MIITRLLGGMGNQMFQYALGRTLALKHDTPLKLDITFLLDRTPRKDFCFRDYALNVFNIEERFAEVSEIRDFVVPPPLRRKLTHRIKAKLGLRTEPKYANRVVTEVHFHFDENILSTPDNSYLKGYWQSYKYFADVEDTLRKDFTFKSDLDHESKTMSKKIESTNAICVNARRTDFADHGIQTCSLDYFHQSIERIAAEVSHPHFFVFSDDLKWCEDNLKIRWPFTIVTHNCAGKQFEHYLRLMSLCKHYIISNSSFAWWAVRLNTNPDKIVIAPRKWCTVKTDDDRDLIPKNWIRI